MSSATIDDQTLVLARIADELGIIRAGQLVLIADVARMGADLLEIRASLCEEEG